MTPTTIKTIESILTAVTKTLNDLFGFPTAPCFSINAYVHTHNIDSSRVRQAFEIQFLSAANPDTWTLVRGDAVWLWRSFPLVNIYFFLHADDLEDLAEWLAPFEKKEEA